MKTADVVSQVSCITPYIFYLCVTWLHQQFSIPVPPLYFVCLSLLTHLIQIISSLEVRSVHELCSNWHAPYTQCPLLPTPWAVEIRWSLLHLGTFIHGLRCSTSSSTDKCDIPLIYTILFNVSHTYMHFEWNTFALNWNHGGISCDVHFAGHLRLNRTNIWSGKSNILNVQSGGARGLELRTADLHTACLLQVVLTRLFITRCRLLK